MKTSFSLTGLAIIFFVLVVGVTAQTTTVVETAPQRTVFQIADQPDAQLKLKVAGPSMGPMSVRLDIENTGDKPIAGYVLLIDVDGSRTSKIVVFPARSLEQSRSDTQGLGISAGGQKAADKVSIVIDLIFFSDGSSWGADTRGGSAAIKAFLAGRDLAMKRLDEMIAESGLNRESILSQFRSFGTSGFGSNIEMKLDLKRFRLDGYTTIIRILRAPSRPESQELGPKIGIAGKFARSVRSAQNVALILPIDYAPR